MSKDRLRRIKRDAQKKHFRRRAKERLGYDLPPAAISGIRNSIRQQHAKLLARPSLRIGIWSVRYGERDLVVVYDYETDELVTVMTTGMYQETDICNSPKGEDADDLKSSIENTPAGKALMDMRRKLNG